MVMEEKRSDPLAFMSSDLTGEYYSIVLSRLHDVLKPRSYLEIGVLAGDVLKYARCPSIGVDPKFDFRDIAVVNEIVKKPELHLFQMTSDDFFATHSPTALFGRPIDMAFLDGMHRCEYLLRDFINVERHCKKNSVVVLHDCLPAEVGITERAQNRAQAISVNRKDWWTGDVWRTALLLKRRRLDLSVTTIDAAPTGLVLITNLDPANMALSENYQEHVTEMFSWDLSKIGIPNYFAEMNVISTSLMSTSEGITERFWL
jgi:hypothetical protein